MPEFIPALAASAPDRKSIPLKRLTNETIFSLPPAMMTVEWDAPENGITREQFYNGMFRLQTTTPDAMSYLARLRDAVASDMPLEQINFGEDLQLAAAVEKVRARSPRKLARLEAEGYVPRHVMGKCLGGAYAEGEIAFLKGGPVVPGDAVAVVADSMPTPFMKYLLGCFRPKSETVFAFLCIEPFLVLTVGESLIRHMARVDYVGRVDGTVRAAKGLREVDKVKWWPRLTERLGDPVAPPQRPAGQPSLDAAFLESLGEIRRRAAGLPEKLAA